MFPFQNYPFLHPNSDLTSSQSIPFHSQYIPKSEIPTTIPQMYTADLQQPYNNLPSLLTKRPPPTELHSAPAKYVHREAFPFNGEVYRSQELPKSHMTPSKQDEINAHKLLQKSQQELNNLAKAQALGAQQYPGLLNGLSLAGLDLSQAELQSYLGETPSQAYIRQYLESQGNVRDYGNQFSQQSNDSLQKYIANMYGLQNSLPSSLGLQGLSGLGNIGGLGSLASLGNLSNLVNLNNPLMLELLNQNRNQQVFQQLAGMPLLQSLPDVMKKDPNNRNLGLDLMLLQSSMAQNSLLSQLQGINMGPPTMPQSMSPPTPVNSSKGTAQTLILQRPDPSKQESALTRKDSIHSAGGLQMLGREASREEVKNKGMSFINVETKSNKEQPERLVKPNKIVEQEVREIREERINREEKQVRNANNRQVETPKAAKSEMQASKPLRIPPVQETVTETIKEKPTERRKNKLQLLAEQMEEQEKAKKAAAMTNSTERPQRRMPNVETAPTESQQQRGNQGLRNKRSEQLGAAKASMSVERVEKEEQKTLFSSSPLTLKEKNNSDMSRNSVGGRLQGLTMEDNRGQSVLSQMLASDTTTNQLGENFYKTPEEIQAENAVVTVKKTRAGFRYQAEIPDMILNDEEEEENSRRRNCKLTWDPQVVNAKEIGNYLKRLHGILGNQIISQEKALKLLSKKNFDMEEVLSTVKSNERYYSNFFGISNCSRELRSRKNIE